MAVTDISELRKKRQAKKTRNTIIRVFFVLLICGAVFVGVITKDMWYPYLEGILTQIPESVQQPVGSSAELAHGRFPITVEGGTGYQLKKIDNSLALLDDSQFHIYNDDGNVMYERQHTYANPILSVSNSKALIYDEGGRDFSLESKYKNIYEKTADDVIYLAKLSASDYAAIVTKSDKFLAMLKVYNANGESVFTYYSYDSRIINVTFNDNSGGCVVTVVTAQGGQLMSKMIRFDFTDTEPKWISDSIPTLALDVRFAEDGSIIMLGDTMMAGFSADGLLLSEYTYNYKITDYDSNSKASAVITHNADLRRTEMITVAGSDCSAAVVTVLDESAEDVYVDNSYAYVLSDDRIDSYNIDGTKVGEIILEDTYDDLCKTNKYIYLMGYDTINRIDYAD